MTVYGELEGGGASAATSSEKNENFEQEVV